MIDVIQDTPRRASLSTAPNLYQYSQYETAPKLVHERSFESLDFTAASTISFPESLDNFRENAKKSNNPSTQLSFVRYLLDSSIKIREDPEQLGIELPSSPPGEGPSTEERKTTMRKLLEAEALRWLKRLASSGVGIGRQPCADAQFMLAEYYGKGLLSLPVDHAKAFNLYVQASKQNHPTATYRAAVCYEVGAGTKKDYNRAVQFYRKAAALSDSHAMHKVALILLYGKLGQRKNLKEGITWLKRASGAADEFHPESLHDLAQCYEKKGGCPVLIPDEHYSFELYARAAQFGFAPSQYRLGSCYEYGLLGCQVDPSNSIKWYSKAAEQGFPDAELALSSWYLSGSHGVLQQSDSDAYLWARKAGDRGHAKAEYQVGNYFEIGIGVEASSEEAKRWYGRAAGKGHKRASQRLSELKKAGKKQAGRCIVA
jgi:TPR repeat protein